MWEIVKIDDSANSICKSFLRMEDSQNLSNDEKNTSVLDEIFTENFSYGRSKLNKSFFLFIK